MQSFDAYLKRMSADVVSYLIGGCDGERLDALGDVFQLLVTLGRHSGVLCQKVGQPLSEMELRLGHNFPFSSVRSLLSLQSLGPPEHTSFVHFV